MSRSPTSSHTPAPRDGQDEAATQTDGFSGRGSDDRGASSGHGFDIGAYCHRHELLSRREPDTDRRAAKPDHRFDCGALSSHF
jgi:hypothetical protein